MVLTCSGQRSYPSLIKYNLFGLLVYYCSGQRSYPSLIKLSTAYSAGRYRSGQRSYPSLIKLKMLQTILGMSFRSALIS